MSLESPGRNRSRRSEPGVRLGLALGPRLAPGWPGRLSRSRSGRLVRLKLSRPSRFGCVAWGRSEPGREVLGVAEGPRSRSKSGRFVRLNMSRRSRVGCDASGRELEPRSRLTSGRLEGCPPLPNSRNQLDRSRLESLDGLRDGVAGEDGRDRSDVAPGCCDDRNRSRRESSEDDPRVRDSGVLFGLRPCMRLGVGLGREDRSRIEGVLREGDGVGVDRDGL
ncbi:hypothetical protein HOV93_46980 [Planctomycetes bacterium FF15]|uniref:Uncharacterized protein n=1 Tax=Bremerella alba TaxID=980252 RepID=A0A7V8V9N0_9BACT|nr:hypothetical protein [Bremerella alba]